MYRKFDLITSRQHHSRFAGIFSAPNITTTITETSQSHSIFDKTLNLTELNNWYVTIPSAPLLTLPLNGTAIQDITRKNRLWLYGSQIPEPDDTKFERVQSSLTHNLSLIAQALINFIKLGLFSQNIWLYATKMTFDEHINACGKDYATGNVNTYPSYLSITVLHPRCLEITYIDSLCCLEPISPGENPNAEEFVRVIFSGVFVQKVQFSIHTSALEKTKQLCGFPPHHLTLRTKVVEANYYLQPPFTDFTPATLGFREVAITPSPEDLLLFPVPTPAASVCSTPFSTPQPSPRTPRKAFGNVSPRRSAASSASASPPHSPSNPFLKPPEI